MYSWVYTGPYSTQSYVHVDARSMRWYLFPTLYISIRGNKGDGNKATIHSGEWSQTIHVFWWFWWSPNMSRLFLDGHAQCVVWRAVFFLMKLTYMLQDCLDDWHQCPASFGMGAKSWWGTGMIFWGYFSRGSANLSSNRIAITASSLPAH